MAKDIRKISELVIRKAFTVNTETDEKSYDKS